MFFEGKLGSKSIAAASGLSALLLSCGIPSACYAAGPESTDGSVYESNLNPLAPPPPDQNRWFVNGDLAGILVNEKAKVYSPGPNVPNSQIPGASIKVNSTYTITFDAGYFITRDLAVDLYVGIPAYATIQGKGSIGSYGPLVNTLYGPAVLSAQYYYHGFGKFVPYIGLGVNRTFFRDVQHKALYGVKIADAWGTAFQVGGQYKLDHHWAINADFRYIILATHISAGLGPSPDAPRAFAKANVNPAIVEMGVDYSF